MKINKKSIIDISIIILIAVVAIFFVLSVLTKDSNQSTKTKKSQTIQDKNFETTTQDGIQKNTSIGTTIKDGKVVTPEGKPVKNDAIPGTIGAPQQSDLIKNLEKLPIGAIKLSVTEKGFNPLSFEVKAGQVVNLVITAGDAQFHVLKFKDPLLSGVFMGIPGEQTRAITFNAPEKVGEYEFFCDVPGHQDKGEKGKMIVSPVK